MSDKYIYYTDLHKLKKEYKKALEEKKESFIFKGNEILVSYAKYVIEHLESVIKK